MTLFNDIMLYFAESIQVSGWNISILWSPLKIWTPKNFTTANFRHPVSKSWLRHCLSDLLLSLLLSSLLLLSLLLLLLSLSLLSLLLPLSLSTYFLPEWWAWWACCVCPRPPRPPDCSCSGCRPCRSIHRRPLLSRWRSRACRSARWRCSSSVWAAQSCGCCPCTRSRGQWGSAWAAGTLYQRPGKPAHRQGHAKTWRNQEDLKGQKQFSVELDH